VVFDNQVDLALRVSTLIRRKQAVGGDVPISTLAARGNLPLGQVNVCDISAEVGRRHSQVEYWSSATVRRCLNQMLSEVFAESHSVIVESNSGIVESNSGIVESNSGIVE
jgi:F420-0:gamma-glutamyl ligase